MIWLTLCPPLRHVCVSERDQHLFWQWHVAYSMPSHYLNKRCLIINWTIGLWIRTLFSLQKMDLEMQSAICTFLKPYRLHWYTCGIFSCVMHILWYFHTDVWHQCYSLERNGHRGIGLAFTGCTGCFQHEPLPWANVHLLVQCRLECHLNATGWPSVHWDTTGRPSEYLQGTLEHHWKKT